MARATKATRILTNIATTLSRNTLALPLHFLFLGEPEEEGTARRREEDHVASDPHDRAAHVEGAGDEGMTQQVYRRADDPSARERSDDPGTHRKREPAKDRADRRAQHHQRRGDDRKDHVLDHVDRERNRYVRVDR